MQVQHIPRRGRLLLVLPIPCKHTRTHITYDINVHGRGSVNIVWAQLIASQAFCNSTACAESAHGATSTLCKWKRRDSRQNALWKGMRAYSRRQIARAVGASPSASAPAAAAPQSTAASGPSGYGRRSPIASGTALLLVTCHAVSSQSRHQIRNCRPQLSVAHRWADR